jgi:signal peptidase II
MLHWLWVSLVVVVVDQATKLLASSLLGLYEPVAVLPFLNLMLAHNPGAAFSFLADAGGWQRWFFIGIALVVSGILAEWLRRLPHHEKGVAISLALVLGGAIGNVIDRITHGYVVDFIDFHYAGWHWPAFNVADAAITIGVVILLVDSFLPVRKAPRRAGRKS